MYVSSFCPVAPLTIAGPLKSRSIAWCCPQSKPHIPAFYGCTRCASNVEHEMYPIRPTFAAGFKTVSETSVPMQLTVHGTIPPWLRGELTRVGPAVFEACARDSTKVQFETWFDGLPFLHRFNIQSGVGDDVIVHYVSKHVARHIEGAIANSSTSTSYRALLLGTVVDPSRSMFEKIMTSTCVFVITICVRLTWALRGVHMS
jgi:hypothetical protein